MFYFDAYSSFPLPTPAREPEGDCRKEAEEAARAVLKEKGGGFFFSSDMATALLRVRMACKGPQLSSILDSPVVGFMSSDLYSVTDKGFAGPDLRPKLAKQPALVTATIVNSEYSMHFHLPSLLEAVKAGKVFVDATHAVGRMRFEGVPKGVDFLAFGTAPLGALGCTVLWAREPEALDLPELWCGAGRRGWVNEATLASVCHALRAWERSSPEFLGTSREARIAFDEAVLNSKEAALNFADWPLSPEASSYHIKGLNTEALVLGCRKAGLLLSTGQEELGEGFPCSALTAARFAEEMRYSNVRVSPAPLSSAQLGASAAELFLKAVRVARALE